MIDLLDEEPARVSTLTQFFAYNSQNMDGRHLLYNDFPKHFVWKQNRKVWVRRANLSKSIGRIHFVSASNQELYYLRILLYHVRGPTSFIDIKTIDGRTFTTFKETALQYGLCRSDDEYVRTIEEAGLFSSPSRLRFYFSCILVNCSILSARDLWESVNSLLIEDFIHQSSSDPENDALVAIERHLIVLGCSLSYFDLPSVNEVVITENESPVEQMNIENIVLSDDQVAAYNTIMESFTPQGKTY